LFPPPPTPTTMIFAANSEFSDLISNKAAPPLSFLHFRGIIGIYLSHSNKTGNFFLL
jgi:hypothetical protein